jgi:hypothetical protein
LFGVLLGRSHHDWSHIITIFSLFLSIASTSTYVEKYQATHADNFRKKRIRFNFFAFDVGFWPVAYIYLGKGPVLLCSYAYAHGQNRVCTHTLGVCIYIQLIC